jgi:hypothetical protein
MVKSVYNDHPWDSKKVAIVQKWMLFRVGSLRITFSIGKLGIALVFVGR